MDKASLFILNIFLNSFLAFLTVAFLIEGVIFLFRIAEGRVAAILRMIPIIKLPLDLLLYDFSRWSYAQGINPLQCEEGTRILSVTCGWMNDVTAGIILPIQTGIQLTVPGDLTFTIADIIGRAINPSILRVFALMLIAITVCLTIRKLILYYRSLVELDLLAKNSQPLDRKMHNSLLSSCIRKSGVRILTSKTSTGSPFVAGLISSSIYISSGLSQNLSRKEYEAVLAHEMEHVRCNDSLVRLILDFLGTVFWWIPTKWLCSYIQEGQEIGCDQKCKKYGINPADLASAVCKSAKYSINAPIHVFAHHLSKHSILKRVNLLLQPTSTRFTKIRFTFTCLATGIALVAILLGRFWTF